MTVRVAISVLNHQAAALSLDCVRHLERARAAVGETCEVQLWLLDNGSDDGDWQALQSGLSGHEWVTLSRSQENSGFSAGHNSNLRQVFAGFDPDYLWLLNNDCLVEENCIGALLTSAAGQTDVDLWGATLLEADRATVQCAGGCFYSPWLTTYRQFAAGSARSRLDELQPGLFDYIAGASMWIPVRTLEERLAPPPGRAKADRDEGGHWLNEAFFLYFEELDLARRLGSDRRLGWCRDAVIVHGRGRNAGNPERRKTAEYHSDLSALKYTALYEPRKAWFAFPARFVLKMLRHLVLLRWYLVPGLFRAYCDYFAWRRGQS